jgi:DMSO/TMAO reductase YedYZ molybdopterin-dependent catalytic subunit
VNRKLSRRKVLAGGAAAALGATSVGVVARLASRHGLVPPDHGGLYGIGATLTYAAQRILTAHQPLAREFDRAQISKIAPVNGGPPADETYLRLMAGDFAEWRLTVDGLVARPSSFSLAELQRLPAHSQITHLACEEGWSYVAEWTGVPLAYLLELVGVRAEARYVVFYPYDEWWDSLDMADALHPQTLLAYGMNGRTLSAGHGAPVRLRVPRQLGYKSFKYLARVSVVDSLDGIGEGRGSAAAEAGYSWYAGI